MCFSHNTRGIRICSVIQWNLVGVNSRGPSEKVHFKRNFTKSVAIYVGMIMFGDIKVVQIKQVFRFNRVHYKEVPLYSGTSDKGPSEIETTSLQRTLVAAPC